MSDLPFGNLPTLQEMPESLRRKLQILWRRAQTKEMIAYGGIWRDAATSTPISLTTSWQVLTGYTENRPAEPKKVNADYTNQLVELIEDGVYETSYTFVVDSTSNNRTVEFGLQIDGVDPANPITTKTFSNSTSAESVSFSTMIDAATTGQDLKVVVRGQNAFTMNFYRGGWYVNRIDYT